MFDPRESGNRVTLAINLQLHGGSHGASARIELHRADPGATALVRVRGRLGRIALQRLAETLEDLAVRGVRRLLLDCSELGDIPRETVGSLIDALVRFESRSGTYAVCGLTQRLRDRFRYAGCESGLHPWTPATTLVAPSLALGASGEWAT
jgi:anti-anti-sigma regulatory factor